MTAGNDRTCCDRAVQDDQRRRNAGPDYDREVLHPNGAPDHHRAPARVGVVTDRGLVHLTDLPSEEPQ